MCGSLTLGTRARVGRKSDLQRSQTESLTTSEFYALEFYDSRQPERDALAVLSGILVAPSARAKWLFRCGNLRVACAAPSTRVIEASTKSSPHDFNFLAATGRCGSAS